MEKGGDSEKRNKESVTAQWMLSGETQTDSGGSRMPQYARGTPDKVLGIGRQENLEECHRSSILGGRNNLESQNRMGQPKSKSSAIR